MQNQMETAFSFIKDEFDINLLQQVLYPDRVMEFNIPVMMDNGKVKMFVGYRSQHNNAKGPYKGGIRFHQQVSKDEVMSLSAWMSIKTSVVGLPLWWGKGWVIVDPKKLSRGELERLSRWFMAKLAPFIGNLIDVPAPDVNTTPQIMGWMVDEYSKLAGVWTPGVITGKPLSLGWSQGREEATALGGLYVLEQYFIHHKDSIKGKSVVVQWAGNAGLTFATLAEQAWAKVIAISDSSWAIYNKDGLFVAEIVALKNKHASVQDYKNSSKISNAELLLLETDILVPAALENQITKDNADQLKAKLVLELANGPTTAEADEILFNKWITVIPDVLANAGWVTVSYFEQVQNNMNYYRSKEEVNEKLEKIMKPSTSDVIATAEQNKTSLRMGAYVIGLKRILQAMKDRK